MEDAELEKIQLSVASMAMDKDALVKCKCGNEFYFEKGDEMVYMKKDDGKVITKTAANHLRANRVRCPACATNFCVACKAEPYHLGLNCQQYEKERTMKKCRFC